MQDKLGEFYENLRINKYKIYENICIIFFVIFLIDAVVWSLWNQFANYFRNRGYLPVKNIITFA
jgi:hypothetical protein